MITTIGYCLNPTLNFFDLFTINELSFLTTYLKINADGFITWLINERVNFFYFYLHPDVSGKQKTPKANAMGVRCLGSL